MDEPETGIALSAVVRNSGLIALILLKITFSGGWSGPKENIVLDPQLLGSQPLLHLLAGLKLASSKSMNSFHQLPALTPSKNTFTVGKTNTDNSDIYIYIYIFF